MRLLIIFVFIQNLILNSDVDVRKSHDYQQIEHTITISWTIIGEVQEEMVETNKQITEQNKLWINHIMTEQVKITETRNKLAVIKEQLQNLIVETFEKVEEYRYNCFLPQQEFWYYQHLVEVWKAKITKFQENMDKYQMIYEKLVFRLEPMCKGENPELNLELLRDFIIYKSKLSFYAEWVISKKAAQDQICNDLITDSHHELSTARFLQTTSSTRMQTLLQLAEKSTAAQGQLTQIVPSLNCMHDCLSKIPRQVAFRQVGITFRLLIMLTYEMSQTFNDLQHYLNWILKWRQEVTIIEKEIIEIKKIIEIFKLRLNHITEVWTECREEKYGQQLINVFHEQVYYLQKYNDMYYTIYKSNEQIYGVWTETEIEVLDGLVLYINDNCTKVWPEESQLVMKSMIIEKIKKFLVNMKDVDYIEWTNLKKGCESTCKIGEITHQSRTKWRPCLAVRRTMISTDITNKDRKDPDHNDLQDCHYTELVNNGGKDSDNTDFSMVITSDINNKHYKRSQRCRSSQEFSNPGEGIGYVYKPEMPIFNVANPEFCMECGSVDEKPFQCKTEFMLYSADYNDFKLHISTCCNYVMDFTFCVQCQGTVDLQDTTRQIVYHQNKMIETDNQIQMAINSLKTQSRFHICTLMSTSATIMKFDLTDHEVCEPCNPIYITSKFDQQITQNYSKNKFYQRPELELDIDMTPKEAVTIPYKTGVRDLLDTDKMKMCGLQVDRYSKLSFSALTQDTLNFNHFILSIANMQKVACLLNDSDPDATSIVYAFKDDNETNIFNSESYLQNQRKMYQKMFWNFEGSDKPCLVQRLLNRKSDNHKGVALKRLNWSGPALSIHTNELFSFKQQWDLSAYHYSEESKKDTTPVINQISKDKIRTKFDTLFDWPSESDKQKNTQVVPSLDFFQNTTVHNGESQADTSSFEEKYGIENKSTMQLQVQNFPVIQKWVLQKENKDLFINTEINVHVENDKNSERESFQKACYIKQDECLQGNPNKNFLQSEEGRVSSCHYAGLQGALNVNYDHPLFKKWFSLEETTAEGKQVDAKFKEAMLAEADKPSNLAFKDNQLKEGDDIWRGRGDNAYDESKPDGISKFQEANNNSTDFAVKGFAFSDYIFTDFHQGLQCDYYQWNSKFIQDGDQETVENYNQRLAPQAADLYDFVNEKLVDNGELPFEVCLQVKEKNTEEGERDMRSIWCKSLSTFLTEFVADPVDDAKQVNIKFDKRREEVDYQTCVLDNRMEDVNDKRDYGCK